MGPRIVAPPWRRGGIIVSDSFDRGDTLSPHSLGNADTGQLWTAHDGEWGISADRAYCPVNGAGAANHATVDAGVSDAIVQVTFSTFGERAGLVCRFVDVDNFLQVWGDGSTPWALYKFVAGVVTALGSSAVNSAAGDVVRVVLAGSSVKVSINSALQIDVTEAAHQSATRYGLRTLNHAASPNTRFDDFSVAA